VGVFESGDKKYQFSRFVTRIAGAVTEMNTRCAQGSRATLNRGTDALGCANGFGGCVG
jgi:hypothetical protein